MYILKEECNVNIEKEMGGNQNNDICNPINNSVQQVARVST
jgi:hypothetical protein